MLEQNAELINNIARAGSNFDGVKDKVNQLMPSLPMMLSTIGALIFLILVLHLMLYKPISKMVKNRKNFIQKNIDDAIGARDEATQLSEKAFLELSKAREMANEIINRAKKEAEITKIEYIDKAKKEAKRLLGETNLDIQNLRQKFEDSKKEQIIDAAIIISEKIIEDKIKNQDMDKYYSEFIKDDLNVH